MISKLKGHALLKEKLNQFMRIELMMVHNGSLIRTLKALDKYQWGATQTSYRLSGVLIKSETPIDI